MGNWNDLFRKKRRPSPGTPPGTITVDEGFPAPSVSVISYNESKLQEHRSVTLEELKRILSLNNNLIHWIDVQGLGDEKLLRELGDYFKIHPLALEDVVNAPQMPKTDQFADHVFIVVRMIQLISPQVLASEQMSIFLGRNYVLTLQERPGDCLDSLRSRLREGKGIIRRMKADYLCYAVMDAIIDNYFPVVENLGERFEDLEDGIISGERTASIGAFYSLKHETIALRRIIWQMRSTVGSVMRGGSGLVCTETTPFFRDCYEHLVHMIDITEAYRELQAEIMSIYLTTVSNRMNEIMKVLTIIATIFIPLSFVAGIYGMNFAYMPELENRHAYYIVLTVMVIAGLAMLAVFWKKGWLKSSNASKSVRQRSRNDD